MVHGDRIAKLGIEAKKFGDSIKDIIDVIAVELPYIGHIKGNSCLKVAEARGALISGLINCFDPDNLPPVIDITAVEAKKAVGVNTKLKRQDSKKAVRKSIIKMFPSMQTENQDVLDAISVAVAGAKKFKTLKIINNFIT
jgi:Holliday junction resolvasome RuvABC endonuclease subunit